MKKQKNNIKVIDYNLPCYCHINKLIDIWYYDDDMISYREQEDALTELFGHYNKNKDITHILIKCSALNDFYSTNLFNVNQIAHHIQSKNIDEKMAKGDISVVNDIAKIIITDKNGIEKTRINYSFATKYCSHHYPDKYYIYDNYVGKLLNYINSHYEWHFANFSISTISKDYEAYVDVLHKFILFFDLTDFSPKQLDKYLWLLGKAAFSKYNDNDWLVKEILTPKVDYVVPSFIHSLVYDEMRKNGYNRAKKLSSPSYELYELYNEGGKFDNSQNAKNLIIKYCDKRITYLNNDEDFAFNLSLYKDYCFFGGHSRSVSPDFGIFIHTEADHFNHHHDNRSDSRLKHLVSLFSKDHPELFPDWMNKTNKEVMALLLNEMFTWTQSPNKDLARAYIYMYYLEKKNEDDKLVLQI